MAVYVVDHPELTDDREFIIRMAFSDLIPAATGHRWDGPYQVVQAPVWHLGTTNVILVDYLEGNPCGRASVGWWPAWIRLATRHECINRGFFPDLVGHELGHVLGFRHVSDSNMVMAAGGRPHQRFRFSPPELYHARLAYRMGRGMRLLRRLARRRVLNPVMS